MITRRHLLTSLLAFAGYGVLPFASTAWAATAPDGREAPGRLVVIMLRGAVDGLNVVIPHADPHYESLRPGIAIQRPGYNGGAIDLGQGFGLHPALEALSPFWEQQSLAFVHACGLPVTTRSHFEAQDLLESAVLQSNTTREGWLARLAQQLPVTTPSPTRLVSVGSTVPKIFQGATNVALVPSRSGQIRRQNMGNDAMNNRIMQLYADTPQLSSLYNQATSARASLAADFDKATAMEGQTAPGSKEFTNTATMAAQLIRKDPNIEIMFMDIGGWDTHVNQGGATGSLANKLNDLGLGLAAFARGLGEAYTSTTILVMSEFGRTARQNGNGGTDHGHGNVAMVLGGSVHGGAVYGQWPGLANAQLYEGRDLAITTDIRAVIHRVIQGTFGARAGLSDTSIASILPGVNASPFLGSLMRY